MGLKLFVVEARKPTPALACVRRVTHESIAVIRDRIERGAPVIEIQLSSTDWDEESRSFLALLEELDRRDIPYRLFEDEFEVSRAFVENVVAESARERERQERLMQLESGMAETE